MIGSGCFKYLLIHVKKQTKNRQVRNVMAVRTALLLCFQLLPTPLCEAFIKCKKYFVYMGKYT